MTEKEFNNEFKVIAKYSPLNRTETFKFLQSYEMFRWTKTSDGLIRTGYRPSDAVEFILTGIPWTNEGFSFDPNKKE